MHELGVKHHLDEENCIILPTGVRATIVRQACALEFSFGPPTSVAYAARTSLLPPAAQRERSSAVTRLVSPARGSSSPTTVSQDR